MIISRCALALLAAGCLTITGCGTGGGSATGQSPLPTTVQSTQTNPVSIAVSVPAAQSGAGSLKTLSLSTLTKSIAIKGYVNGGLVAQGMSECNSAQCKFVLAMPAGNVELHVTTYAGDWASGAVLTTNIADITVAPGPTNQFNVVYDGTVATSTVTLTSPQAIPGTPSTITGYVTSRDAQGSFIIGNDAFPAATAITLQGDGAHEFSLTKSTITSPSDNSFSIAYNGGRISEGVQIAANFSGGTSPLVYIPLSSVGAVTMFTENPTWSNRFVDSIGVNTHFHYTATAYYQNYPAVKAALLGSGIRHIRDSLTLTNDASYFSHLSDLSQNGIHGELSAAITTTPQLVAQYATALPGFIEAVEPPNEIDVSGDPNWIADGKNFQSSLYQDVKSTPGLANVPVLGPSLSQAWPYGEIGNIQADADYGNLHNYMGGHNPGSTGWGAWAFGYGYGAIRYWMGAAAQATGNEPIMTTESGYCTSVGVSGAVDLTTEGRYMPRLFLEQWNAGIARTYAYELVDEGTGCNGTYGLLSAGFSPKPGYQAIKGLINTLNDTGSSFTGQSLNYGVSSNPGTIHHALFQKQDGTYILALWNEIVSANSGGGALPATQVPVIVTLPSAPASAQASQFDDTGTLQSATAAVSGSQVGVSVSDRVTLLSFHL